MARKNNGIRTGLWGLQGAANDQMNWIAQMFPQWQSNATNAFNLMGPGGNQARIDAFRNNQIQSAARMGKQNANLSRWGGLGSGSQEAFMNQAGQQAQNNIGQYMIDLQSPEAVMAQLGAQQAMLNPWMAQTHQGLWGQLRQNQAMKPKPSGGFFNQLLGAAGQIYGMGGFGGFGGGGASGGGGIGGGFNGAGSGGMTGVPTPTRPRVNAPFGGGNWGGFG